MENKYVGWLLIGISIFIIIMIFLFGNSAKSILDHSCPIIQEGYTCPAYEAINRQTYFALAVIGILVLVGVYFILSKPEKETIFKIKTIGKKENRKKVDISSLTSEEKKVFSLLQEQRAIFQSDLVERTGINKVKMSRILDRLEGKGFVERKRRGMTNIVVLKE